MKYEKNIREERYIQELHSIIFFTWVRLSYSGGSRNKRKMDRKWERIGVLKGLKKGKNVSNESFP